LTYLVIILHVASDGAQPLGAEEIWGLIQIILVRI